MLLDMVQSLFFGSQDQRGFIVAEDSLASIFTGLSRFVSKHPSSVFASILNYRPKLFFQMWLLLKIIALNAERKL